MTSATSKEPDLDQQINFIKKIQFFATFDDHEIRQFLLVSRWLKVPANTTIIKEGALERVFYILVKGKVSVFKSLGDKETIQLTTLSTGDCFGEMALVGEIKRTAGVKTTKDSFILMVEPNIISTSNVFLQLKFYKRFCEILVSRLVLANQRMVAPATEEVAPEERLQPEVEATPPAGGEVEEKRPAPTAGPPPPSTPKRLPPPPASTGRINPVKLQRRLQPDQLMAINPEPAERLSPFLESGSENTRALAELIALDPILSCKVLQTANSPFFRRSCPVTSVPHAMIIVGIQHIQKVIRETIETNEGLVLFSGYKVLRQRFWHHAVVVARIAQLLKDVIRINTATDIYLAGLLHDLGKLGLDALEPAFFPQMLKPDSEFRTAR
ncbi:MAG: HDOD domain-containing protein, partial [Desulfobulbaceae bacterium]|nr:HDOD domain-containing protein [Desulfobulbaceae bacterium]